MNFEIDKYNFTVKEINLCRGFFAKLNHGMAPTELVIHKDDFNRLKENTSLLYFNQEPYNIFGMHIIRTTDVPKGQIKMY